MIHGGSWVVRQQLCPPFSGHQSPQETCSLPLHSRPCVLLLSLLRGRKSQFLQGLVLLAKRVAEDRTQKLLWELHTHIPHPTVKNPKNCTYSLSHACWETGNLCILSQVNCQSTIRATVYLVCILSQPWAPKVCTNRRRSMKCERSHPGVMRCCCGLPLPRL